MTNRFKIGTAIGLFTASAGMMFLAGPWSAFFSGAVFSLGLLLIIANCPGDFWE